MAVGGRALGGNKVLMENSLRMGISVHEKEAPENSLSPFQQVRTQGEDAIHES